MPLLTCLIAEQELPRERKKLELAPRGSAAPTDSPRGDGGEAAPPKKKSDPFGGARPVDVTTVEKRVEEKLKQKEAEEKQLAEEAKAKKAAAAAAAAAEGTDKEKEKTPRPAPRGPAGDKEGKPPREAPASKADATTSWRSSGPKTESAGKRDGGWETAKKDDKPKKEGKQGGEPKADADSKAADELVSKVNSFSILEDAVSTVWVYLLFLKRHSMLMTVSTDSQEAAAE